MNREDIIRMALKVGLEQDGDNFFSPKSDPQVDVHITDLEAFAALVVSVERDKLQGQIETLHAMYELASKQRDYLVDKQQAQVTTMRGKMQ